MNKATTYNLPSVAVIGCRLVLLAIPSCSWLLGFTYALVNFLEGEHLYFELPDSDFISIEFFPLIDTIPFKLGRRNLLRLSKELGEYNEWQIVWDPKSKKISCYDIEHQELRELCKFDEFMADMSGQLETLF